MIRLASPRREASDSIPGLSDSHAFDSHLGDDKGPLRPLHVYSCLAGRGTS